MPALSARRGGAGLHANGGGALRLRCYDARRRHGHGGRALLVRRGRPAGQLSSSFPVGRPGGRFQFPDRLRHRRRLLQSGLQAEGARRHARACDEAEHDAWKKTGVKNVVPAKHNPFLRNADQKSDEHRVGCAGFERIPVVPEVQGLVDAAWPPDHPVYWPVPSTLFVAVPNAFYKAIRAEFLSDESRSLGQGFGMIRREASDRSHSSQIPSQAYKAFDVVPIDFDFFYKDIHGPEFELSVSKPIPRPLIVKGRVDESNLGMMYCGFFPTLFTAVDTIQLYTLRRGTTELVGLRSDIMHSDAAMMKSVGLGMDIERGEDGDE